MTTLAFMLWVVIDVPFMVAFDIPVDVNVWDWHRIVSFVVDVFFMCDVVLNFNTGVEIGGIVSFDRVVIAKDYLKSWFWIDIVSAFPLDLVLQGQGDESSTNSTQLIKLSKMGRVVRMFKLIRLLRIARVMRVVSRLEYTMSTQEAMRTLWKFFAVVVICCHLFSCAFYAIGVSYNGPDEWANGVDASVNTVFAKYVACFYWAIMTTTTIGYGDVSSLGTAQQLFGMLAMLIGALLFGYGVSNVVNIVEELRSGERIFREKMDKFNRYMRSQNFPSDLQDSIRDYLKNVKRVHSERVSIEDEIGLLSQLSLGLRERIAVAVNDIYLRDMPFFAGEDPSVVMELAFCMERCCVGPEEDVIRCGDLGHEMYFILEGRVEILARPKSGGVVRAISIIKQGEFFGEMALLEPQHIRTATVKTITFCEFRCLSADAFNVIASRYPLFGKNLQSIVGERSNSKSFIEGGNLSDMNSAYADILSNQEEEEKQQHEPPKLFDGTAARHRLDALMHDGHPTTTQINTSFDAGANSAPPLNKFGDGRLPPLDPAESGGHRTPSPVPSNTPSPVPSLDGAAAMLNQKPKDKLRGFPERAPPGPLLSPLNNDPLPSKPSRRKSLEQPNASDNKTSEALATVLKLVTSLRDQQTEFSNTILSRMNSFDTELSKLKNQVKEVSDRTPEKTKIEMIPNSNDSSQLQDTNQPHQIEKRASNAFLEIEPEPS
mmetsp:Transcript_50855/g.65111  ORF Transcript_50855/g.65111 Transcript_50855/m.65111 type:complete len:715 (+) Transcript_50855:178-2322(+)